MQASPTLFVFNESELLPKQEDQLYKEIINSYEDFESNISIRYFFDKVTYVSPVNFRESMQTLRHRWFPYKEGFSPSFVKNYLKEFCPSPDSIILDPFAGVGTTLLESSRLGYKAYGFEVSPMSYEIASSKAQSWTVNNLAEFEECLLEFEGAEFRKVASLPDNQTVVSYFDADYLNALLSIKAFYLSIEDKKIKALFKLAFLNCLENYSTHRKAGNGLKKKTRLAYAATLEKPLEQIRQTMLGSLKQFKKDINEEPTINNFNLIKGSCLDQSLYPSDILFDSVLTSPPYANCFDYSKIYIVELWLGDYFTSTQSQKKFRQESIRSHVHARWQERHPEYGISLVNDKIVQFLSEQKLWSSQIPSMIKGYFDDMGKLLFTLSERCRPGAVVSLVVGNSYYGSLPIATDLLLAMISIQFGFEILRIDVYRNVVVSSQQFTQARDRKYMRESLVVLQKI